MPHQMAIALNNVGLDLLALGALHPALDSITASLKLMKAATASSIQNECETASIEHEGRLQMERASAWISSCKSSADTVTIQTLSTETSNRVSSDCDLRTVHLALESLVIHDGKMYPIAIRHHRPLELSGSVCDEEDFHSFVILYNYGVVLAHLADAATDKTCRSEFQQNALKIFQLANLLLDHQIQDQVPAAVSEDNAMDDVASTTDTSGGLWHAQVYLVCSLIRICRDLRMPIADHLVRLEEVLYQINVVLLVRSTETDYAAAAAA